MKKTLFYFGAVRRAGHYLWSCDSNCIREDWASKQIPGLNRTILQSLDSTFAPGSTREQGLYQVCVVPPVMIIAWWDYTQDGRSGSNSALVGYGFKNAEDMLDEMKLIFPTAYGRQERPRPVVV